MKTGARALLLFGLLGWCCAATAQQQTDAQATARPAAYTAPHYDPRGTTQNVCMAPAVGGCEACQVSCPTGESAMCSAGTAMAPQAGSACVAAPSCGCR
jgi:hypothetical protein